MLLRTLKYDTKKWEELSPKPVNTLQVFITNKCNMRCKACFYAHRLGKEELPFKRYQQLISTYKSKIDKIILLGGEPTLHKNLNKIITLNTKLGLKTTIYTNGYNIKMLEHADLSKTTIRIGVYGAELSEKPLEDVPSVNFPVTIVYMLRKDNVQELMKVAKMAEERFNCKGFYISSIRDITATQNYWEDTKETLPLKKYFKTVQDFINNYKGGIRKIHIARRGVITTKNKSLTVNRCRFGNVFPDGKKIICPLDISKKGYAPELRFNERPCNKNKECILQKIVLKRISL
ncbi:MAG: radical SAM protein [Nanoarchaeota archaeon]|nr:radical SAM protein [Nanoarchaeota archaeon]